VYDARVLADVDHGSHHLEVVTPFARVGGGGVLAFLHGHVGQRSVARTRLRVERHYLHPLHSAVHKFVFQRFNGHFLRLQIIKLIVRNRIMICYTFFRQLVFVPALKYFV